MSTPSDPEANGDPAPLPGEYTIPAGYGALQLRETAVPFGAYVDDEPAVRRATPDYRAQARDNLVRTVVVRSRMREDQREIDRLRRETRQILDALLAA